MKIAFVCIGLEPGRDGVGDYCYRLAEQCTSMGHSVILLAINDRLVPDGEPAILKTSQRNAIPLKEVRFSRDRPWSERISQATQILEKFDPDWISQQFVCYGWQRQGVIAREIAYIRALSDAVPRARTHIMMHELWVGDTPEWPLYKRVIGFVQKLCIRKLLTELRPAAIHTSNQSYQERLASIGIRDVPLLPLFSNIPFSSESADQWLYPRLQEFGMTRATPATREQYLFCGLFGSLPAVWPAEPVLPALIDAGTKSGKTPVLLSGGRLGTDGEALWNDMKIRYAGKLALVNLGELSPLHVSEYLSILDLGIAVAVLKQIGKSSAVATMLDHGLPVIVNRVDSPNFQPWDDRSRYLLHVLDDTLTDKITDGLPRLPKASSVEEIANRFLCALKLPGTT